MKCTTHYEWTCADIISSRLHLKQFAENGNHFHSVMSAYIHGNSCWCCVSVPRVPVLCTERDWLHCVSHAVLEDSRSRPPPPITWEILHKHKLGVRHTLVKASETYFALFLLTKLSVWWVREVCAALAGCELTHTLIPCESRIDFFCSTSH